MKNGSEIRKMRRSIHPYIFCTPNTVFQFFIVIFLFTYASAQSSFKLIGDSSNVRFNPGTSWKCLTTALPTEIPSGSVTLQIYVQEPLDDIMYVDVENHGIGCRNREYKQIPCKVLQSRPDEMAILQCTLSIPEQVYGEMNSRCVVHSKSIPIIDSRLGTSCHGKYTMILDENGNIACSECCRGSSYNESAHLCERCPSGFTTNKNGFASRCHRFKNPETTLASPTIPETTLEVFNVTVSKIMTDSVNLTWVTNIQNTRLHKFQIHLCSETPKTTCKFHTALHTYLYVYHLKPKTTYSAKVAFLTKRSRQTWSQKIKFTTRGKSPSVKVWNVHEAYSNDFTELILTWDKPTQIHDETVYLGYKIVVDSKKKNPQFFTRILPHITLSVNPNSIYNIQILIFNSEGEGPTVSSKYLVPGGMTPYPAENTAIKITLIIVGGLIVFFIIFLVVWCWYRRCCRRRTLP